MTYFVGIVKLYLLASKNLPAIEHYFKWMVNIIMKKRLEDKYEPVDGRSQIGLYEMLALAKVDSDSGNSSVIESLAQKVQDEAVKDEFNN